MSKIRRLITSNFSPVRIVFRRFLTWIVQGDADLHFSMMLVRKANAAEEEVNLIGRSTGRLKDAVVQMEGEANEVGLRIN